MSRFEDPSRSPYNFFKHQKVQPKPPGRRRIWHRRRVFRIHEDAAERLVRCVLKGGGHGSMPCGLMWTCVDKSLADTIIMYYLCANVRTFVHYISRFTQDIVCMLLTLQNQCTYAYHTQHKRTMKQILRYIPVD